MTPGVSSFVRIFGTQLTLSPVSELHITECMLDPWFLPSVAADFCYPPSTKGDDALKGKWVRVERNLKEQLSMKDLVRLALF